VRFDEKIFDSKKKRLIRQIRNIYELKRNVNNGRNVENTVGQTILSNYRSINYLNHYIEARNGLLACYHLLSTHLL
jgi:hypothetical protein